MGWRFKWVSSFGSDFNYDFHVSFTPEEDSANGKVLLQLRRCGELPQRGSCRASSVFYKDDERRRSSTPTRPTPAALDVLVGTYMFLDLAPKGRDEDGPNHNLTDWVRHHDRYDDAGFVDATGRWRTSEQSQAEPACCCA